MSAPRIFNPEAVGDPNQTPRVQLFPAGCQVTRRCPIPDDPCGVPGRPYCWDPASQPITENGERP